MCRRESYKKVYNIYVLWVFNVPTYIDVIYSNKLYTSTNQACVLITIQICTKKKTFEPFFNRIDPIRPYLAHTYIYTLWLSPITITMEVTYINYIYTNESTMWGCRRASWHKNTTSKRFPFVVGGYNEMSLKKKTISKHFSPPFSFHRRYYYPCFFSFALRSLALPLSFFLFERVVNSSRAH